MATQGLTWLVHSVVPVDSRIKLSEFWMEIEGWLGHIFIYSYTIARSINFQNQTSIRLFSGSLPAQSSLQYPILLLRVKDPDFT